MPDKTEEQRKEEEQENPEARAEELTDEQLDQTAGGANWGAALKTATNAAKVIQATRNK
jgi:hypothetical protein